MLSEAKHPDEKLYFIKNDSLDIKAHFVTSLTPFVQNDIVVYLSPKLPLGTVIDCETSFRGKAEALPE